MLKTPLEHERLAGDWVAAQAVAMAPGATIWTAPLPPHSVENVGEGELRAIAVEVKGALGI